MIWRGLLLILVSLGSIIFFFSFFWMVSTSLKSAHEVIQFPPVWIPAQLRWVNSLKPLTIPVYFADPFFIFLSRQYSMTISPESDDAAKIDGCGFFSIYWRIILPLSKPVLGIVAIYEFLWDWNNFFDPLIYINSPKKFPVALGLRMLHGTLYHVPEQHIMAMTFVSLIPVLVVFVATQRYFIQGIVVSGIKG